MKYKIYKATQSINVYEKSYSSNSNKVIDIINKNDIFITEVNAYKYFIKIYRINERKASGYIQVISGFEQTKIDNRKEVSNYYTINVDKATGIAKHYKTINTTNLYNIAEPDRKQMRTIRVGELLEIDKVAYAPHDILLHVTKIGQSKNNGWVYLNRNIVETNIETITVETYDKAVSKNNQTSGGSTSGSNSTIEIVNDSNSNSSTKKETETIVTDMIDEAKKRMEGTNSSSYLEYTEILAELEENLTMKSARGIMGLPYQWMPHQDARLDGTKKLDSIGRKFGDKILSKVPLLFITPGTPQFLSTASKKEKEGILGLFFKDTDEEYSALDQLLQKDKRYYSLKYAYIEYFNYVNSLTRIGARYLNLQNEKLDGVNLDEYDWYTNRNEAMGSFLGTYAGALAFYVNSETSINDSFGNSTTQSSIASMVNGISDTAKELNFILGTGTSALGMAMDKFINEEDLKKSTEEQSNLVKDILGENNIFSSLVGKFKNLVSGGKLIFPEIWADSDFSRSYSVSIKLVTPDNDKLSWFLNIYVPLCHLLCLVLPRESGDVNTYRSPFLVRAFYKGLFNVDMGIITDLSVTKGSEGAWTKDGLPTTVDVSFSIKDLYQHLNLSTTTQSGKMNIFNNIALLDYIGNWCGININEPDLFRSIDLFVTQNLVNKVKDALTLNLFGRLGQAINTQTMQIFASLFN